jgi:hypothetical protein
MNPSDQDYYLARAGQERVLAEQANDQSVRTIHLQLAREYEARASAREVPAASDSDVTGLTSDGGRFSSHVADPLPEQPDPVSDHRSPTQPQA